MDIKLTKFKDLMIIKSEIHSDNRGHFLELFRNNFIKKKFVFTCSSKSKKNVLRGMHLQTKFSQGKYITVLKGEIYDVAVDLRKKSKTFGKYFSIKLSDKNGLSIYIPPGFAHGFIALKKANIITYHCPNYRSAIHETGLIWNDKDLKIKWPVRRPILSKKDKKNITLAEYKNKYG